MMDALYKRYACPFDFINSAFRLGKLEESLLNVIKQNDEDKLWQLYLHSMKEKSYEDWKKEIMKPEESKALTDAEITTQVQKANNLLTSFSMKGGKE